MSGPARGRRRKPAGQPEAARPLKPAGPPEAARPSKPARPSVAARPPKPGRTPAAARPSKPAPPSAAARSPGPARPPGPTGDVLYGRNPVREALRAGRRRVHEVWTTTGAAREPWLRDASVHVVDVGEVARIAGSDAHQGVCARVDPYPYADEAQLLAGVGGGLLVALDEVQDPQNVGAICRTAECAGAAGVVMPERRAPGVTAAVAKASAGAVEHLRVARVRNLADFLGEAKQAGCWCYGAAAGEGSIPWDQPDWRGGVVLVLGGEGKGLRPRVAASCDALVALPLRGEVSSLNVSAAAAALLYGILHLREHA